MAAYEDGFWWSHDGLRLHYRDYNAAGADRPPILCLPGLTRNARDFEGLAERLSDRWRIVAVELRGRAESAYAKDAMTYVPLTYLQDLELLISTLNIRRFVGVGTSLGGIMLMLLAATGRERIAGAVLNDIGPVIEQSGLDRLRQTVGSGVNHPTWVHAARALAATNGAIYPDYRLNDWVDFAKRLYRLNGQGRIVLDYDQRIAEPFRVPGGEVGVDLWPAFDALAGSPALLLRGETSDILSPKTAGEMARRMPGLDFVTLPRIGHAPTLDEPVCVAAIDRLLERALAAETVT